MPVRQANSDIESFIFTYLKKIITQNLLTETTHKAWMFTTVSSYYTKELKMCMIKKMWVCMEYIYIISLLENGKAVVDFL